MPADPYIGFGDAQVVLMKYNLPIADQNDRNLIPDTALLRLASDRVDQMGPFIGARYSPSQVRAFPRSVTLDGDDEGVVPQAIKDWVALEACRLQQEDDPPMTSYSLGSMSETFSRGKRSRIAMLQENLVGRYQHRTALVRG